jgi:hypothetical protein
MTKKQDPDPLVRGMDPRIRIHTKMSCIQELPRTQSDKAYEICRLDNTVGPPVRGNETFQLSFPVAATAPALCCCSCPVLPMLSSSLKDRAKLTKGRNFKFGKKKHHAMKNKRNFSYINRFVHFVKELKHYRERGTRLIGQLLPCMDRFWPE